MESVFSLEYYDRIFGERNPDFWELIAALRDELESYIGEMKAAVEARDLGELARLRHMHKPLTANLALHRLCVLETSLANALRASGGPVLLPSLVHEFELQAQAVIRGLDELVPGPR